MAILSLSPVSSTSIFTATSDTDDLSVDSIRGSIFIWDHDEMPHTLTICDNGAMNDNDAISVEGSSNMNGMTITSTDVYGAGRESDIFDDILIGVHLNVTPTNSVVQTE